MQSFRHTIPSFSALVALEAAARLRSITLAAQEIGVTQAAVSRHINALEVELGVSLFRRKHRAIEPTPDCLELAALLATSFNKIQQGVDRARGSSSAKIITIGTTSAFATLWLMPRLPEFRAAFPDYRVRLLSRDTRIGLDVEEVDLLVRFGLPPFEDGRLLGSRSDTLFPVCAPHFAAQIEDVDAFMTDCPDLIEADFADRDWYSWQTWFARTDLRLPKAAPVMRLNHYADVLGAARAGQGVALGWGLLCQHFLDDGSLVRLGPNMIVPEGSYNVLVPHRRRPHAISEAAGKWMTRKWVSKQVSK